MARQSQAGTDIEDRSWWWKCCQQLKIADRVELVLSGPENQSAFPEDLPSEQNQARPRYTAWVEEIEEDKLVLGIKLEQALALKLQTGQKLTFKRAHEDGIWIYEGVVSADRAIRLEISRPLKATRIQRREYCRVAVQRETSFSMADSPDKGGCGLAQDISGGGLSMAVNEEAAIGDRLQIEVPLDNEVVSMQGVVRRIDADRNRGYDYLLGIEFVDPVMIDQDKIIGFVFTRQRKMRKKKFFS